MLFDHTESCAWFGMLKQMADSENILDRPLNQVGGLSAHVVRQLEKEGFSKVSDVVFYLPFRHEDRNKSEITAFQPSPVPVCHYVRVVKTSVRRFGNRRGSGSFEAIVEHASGLGLGHQLTLRWWNMTFMAKVIAEGHELVVHGKVKEWKGRLSMDHPEYEIVNGDEEDEGETIHAGRITPIYRLRGGMAQKSIRTAAWHVAAILPNHFVDDVLPRPRDDGEFAGMSRSFALKEIHFPASPAALEKARRYLALEEFYGFQLRVAKRRREMLSVPGNVMAAGDASLVGQFLDSLPFQLTAAQQRCVQEIHADMAAGRPMNRLLHGDVGSGKTIVAFAAMLRAVECGRQAALMAPTQILAEQHARNARKWLEPLGLRVALMTAARKEDGSGGEMILDSSGDALFSSAKPHLIIGTHALLHNDSLVTDLGLVVIDEQHKFGVAQRARLIKQGRAPDVLVMTATPIPRTLTLTIYGDLDVSTIDQRPQTGVTIVTKVRAANKLKDAAAFLGEQIAEGRQGYLVFPLIEESERTDAAAAVSGHETWSKLLAPHSVGLLHGRMSAEEKDLVMQRFRSGEFQALVSTTVIEVGIDVPNATVMYIHDASRFGLAQLHQLRGRIGRGAHASFCVLFVDDKDEDAKAKLAIMEETSDGFKIAEEDLIRRGPGNVLGHAQSGQAPLRFAELLADTRLVRLARQLADRTLDADPQLARPENRLARDLLAHLPTPGQGMLQ
ncbi:MAG: ATP-dependent DNA helicase RecG [Verrucomicrobiaceae bacterium]|nr:ATP-dependent DNA helicase RecG [Verrucomicrobiaceae bacterium]